MAPRPGFWEICHRFGAEHGWKGRPDRDIELPWNGRRLRIVAGERIAPGWDYTPDPNAGVVVILPLPRKLGVWANPEGTGRLVGQQSRAGAPPDSPAAVLAGLLGANVASRSEGQGEQHVVRSPHQVFASRCPDLVARVGALEGCSVGFDQREAWGELPAASVSLDRLRMLCALVTDLTLEAPARDAEMRSAFRAGWVSPVVREGRRIFWRKALKIYAVVAVVLFVAWCFRGRFR